MTLESVKLPFQEEYIIQIPPRTYGVYALWSSSEILYLGTATPKDGDIRFMLQEHKQRKETAKKKCPYHPAFFQWEPHPDPVKYRSKLLATYRGQNGELPLCNQ